MAGGFGPRPFKEKQMTLTTVEKFSLLLPGRGRVYFGIVDIALDGYVNGTGFVLSAASFNLARLVDVQVQSSDCGGVMFDWDPSSGALQAYTANGTEVANDGLDAKSARLQYWGF